MALNELYKKDARVWVPHQDLVWEGSVLLENYNIGDKVVKLQTDSGVAKEVSIKSSQDLPPLRNPAILIGQNDLTALSYLHEPGVLHNLEVRFCGRQAIYTYCGIVLVAINPYAELQLYGPDIIRTYRGQSNQGLEPHIFAVAEEAYAKLEREKCDLSIIVSGESGAGKTVSAKYAMRYFAAVGGNESETQIERKILASSPIMEAIGNAKTTRNDNSSRFGKFTKLLFTNQLNLMSLTGATMKTYLLEKSRVVFQAPGERNYHIFYQLCSAREQWPELHLEHQDKFRFLNQGRAPNINKVSDLDQFSETLIALSTLGFANDQIKDVVKVCAAILHLGNVTFTPKFKRQSNEMDQESCCLKDDDSYLHLFADILKLNKSSLQKWMTTRQIESTNENVLIPMNQTASEAARDALAKHIYAKLFQHIVNVVNKSLESGRKQHCFIGVLDIYGFETFEINSFEQFCINYANEKLQQQFNQHVFKLEQDQYLKEGIVWTMIEFYDNQPCIDLIESKLGILDLLDEECRVPRGSDESWVGKLNEKCAKYKHFEKTRFGAASFLVKHFSDTVEYSCNGFLEKNRDTVSKELVNVLRESDMDICRTLMTLDDVDDLNDSTKHLGGRVVISAAKNLVMPSKQHKRTVGSQFRDSLTKLISTLHATTPHYVRCIKPNDDKTAFKWEPSKIVQQLRACGVLETVRISAAGFPSRWTYTNFFARYFLLCKQSQMGDDEKTACHYIVETYLVDDDKYRFGHTQIFFRAGQVAYLEQIRTETRKKHIIVVQSMVRQFICRRSFLRKKQLALALQRYGRGYLARQKARAVRQNRAAIIIQRHLRGWLCRQRYNKILKTILLLQQYGRGVIARRNYAIKLTEFKVTEIQRYCRGFLAREAFEKKRKRIIICQSAIRRFLARRLFKKLKAEARTITHMQKMYKGLENKIISLQQRIDELNKANHQLKQKTVEIPELKQQLQKKKALEVELKSLRVLLIDNEESMVLLAKQVETERNERIAILNAKTKAEEQLKADKETLNKENLKLQTKIIEMVENAKAEENISSRRNRLLSEVDNDEIHMSYQKIVKEKEFLETENYMLKEEVNRLIRYAPVSSVTHSRSVSNVSSVNADEDFGYASAKNTLEARKDHLMLTPPTLDRNADKDKANDINYTPEFNDLRASTPNRNHVLTVLKMKKLLEEESNKRRSIEKELKRIQSKQDSSVNPEDSMRASELEIENEKLRRDCQLLRNSINRGVECQELQAQFMALQEENERRREECVQLRTILADRSQSIKSFGLSAGKNHDGNDDSDLNEALQAQKLVNRQLEQELTALTKENNTKFIEMNKIIDSLKSERNKLHDIMHEQIAESSDVASSNESSLNPNQQNIAYLLHEIEANAVTYADTVESNNTLSKNVEELTKKNKVLSNRLREHGLDDTIILNETVQDVAMVIKRAQVYQGIYKYRHEDINIILQRLINELTPRIAITLFPGLPAYVLFMCIRYTDLLNTDQNVRDILTGFIISVKKINRAPNTSEGRVLWIVNSLKLHNLLKQYGGIDEYIQMNTKTQNEQQLKNFDLSEYRQVIHSLIVGLYEQIMRQVQELLKHHIVPAILDHDEMSRGKHQGNRAMSVETPDQRVDPKSLVNQLDHFYKQFKYFGLDEIYIEQMFKQLMYFICTISLNNLMLRQELCIWKTGMKIRYNVSCVEEWARKMSMSNEVFDPLQPLLQVSSLLQSRKSEDDVQTICELCTRLSTAQVMKICKSYQLDDCEKPITQTFIKTLTNKLNERSTNTSDDVFTMDENYLHPLKVVYKYDETKLEEIELPSILNLDTLLTKI